jgi:hypothetical protein
MAAIGAVYVVIGGRPVDDGDSHRGHAVPRRAGQPARSIVLDALDYVAGIRVGVGTVGATESHQNLVEHHIVEDLDVLA